MSTKLQKLLSIGYIVIGTIYLLNPTAGIIELIPDNIPYIGNLDEVAAVFLIINGLKTFGIDITNIFNKSKDK